MQFDLFMYFIEIYSLKKYEKWTNWIDRSNKIIFFIFWIRKSLDAIKFVDNMKNVREINPVRQLRFIVSWWYWIIRNMFEYYSFYLISTDEIIFVFLLSMIKYIFNLSICNAGNFLKLLSTIIIDYYTKPTIWARYYGKMMQNDEIYQYQRLFH